LNFKIESRLYHQETDNMKAGKQFLKRHRAQRRAIFLCFPAFIFVFITIFSTFKIQTPRQQKA